MVYFNSRMKKGLDYEGKKADIIGAKYTTFGLCDMDGYTKGSGPIYDGSRTELPNYLYYELKMSSGSVQSMKADITSQCLNQCHGGIITVIVDCNEIKDQGVGSGNLFNPVVGDYEDLEYDIPM